MKQLIICTTIAAFAGALNEVVAKQESAWLPGKLDIRAGHVATVLEADPQRSPGAPGTYLEYRLLTGEAAGVQAELDKLQAENPYWKAVAHGIDDCVFTVMTGKVDTAAPSAPAAKKAAKKAAAKTTSKTAYKLVVLVALAQP